MKATDNTARNFRPVPPSADLALREQHHSPLAAFIVCALSGMIFGFVIGLLTGFLVWHR